MLIGVYPGSFDPVTNGHIDIIERAAKLCDKLIVAVAINSNKCTLFSLTERENLLREILQESSSDNIEVLSYTGLLVDLCSEKNVSMIFRGIRSFNDFSYEQQIAEVNKQLLPKIETVFLMAKPELAYLSSSVAKEVAQFGGDVSMMLPVSLLKPFLSKIRND